MPECMEASVPALVPASRATCTMHDGTWGCETTSASASQWTETKNKEQRTRTRVTRSMDASHVARYLQRHWKFCVHSVMSCDFLLRGQATQQPWSGVICLFHTSRRVH